MREMDFFIQICCVTAISLWWWLGRELGYFSKIRRSTNKRDEQVLVQSQCKASEH